jgi:hypothetical protein
MRARMVAVSMVVLAWNTGPGGVVGEALGPGDGVRAGAELGELAGAGVLPTGSGRAGLPEVTRGAGWETGRTPHPAAIRLTAAKAARVVITHRGRRAAGQPSMVMAHHYRHDLSWPGTQGPIRKSLVPFWVLPMANGSRNRTFGALNGTLGRSVDAWNGRCSGGDDAVDCPACGLRYDASGACSLWQQDPSVGPGPGSAAGYGYPEPEHGHVAPGVGLDIADADWQPDGRAVNSVPFHQASRASQHELRAIWRAAGHRAASRD